MKRLFLELGGKSATIVLDDADFGDALLAGHGGVLPRRPGLRDPDPDAPARARATTRASRSLKGMLRPPSRTATRRQADVLMGPLISAKQRDRVLGYIEKGIAEGATARARWRPARAPSDRATTSSRRCSPTSTTR